MTTIRTLEIAFEKQIKNILKDFMSRIDYSNFDDSFDEGLYYFNTLTEQPITKAITTVHNAGYKNANTLIKNRMKTAAVVDKSTAILYIVKKLTDRLHTITKNHKEEITEKLIQHQTEQFTYDQIVDDLLTFFDYDTVAASRFARTATNYVYNQAHLQRYKDTGIVPGVRYAAHIDARTSKICRMLDGTIWAVNDPNIIVPPSHFNCLVAGTKIQTHNDLIKIENINIGDYVLTHEDRFRRVTERIIRHSDDDLISIKTINRTINITSNHPIAVFCDKWYKWIDAGNVTVGDKLFILQNSKKIGREEIKSIDKIPADIVYNFSVDEDESYTANGIVVHNCRSRILPYYGKIPDERDYKKDFESEFIKEADNTLKTFKEKYWNM